MAMDFPSGPTVGQIVSLGGNQYIWDGTAWNIVPQQAPAALSDLPPANPAVGQFWWRATNGQLYVYVNDGNSSQWVQAAGQGITPTVWEPINGGLVTFNASPNVNLLNLDAYSDIRIKGWLTNSLAAGINMFTSTDNGATYATATNDYLNQLLNDTGSSTVSALSGVTSAMVLFGGAVIDATQLHTFEINMFRFNKPSVARFHTESGYVFSTALAKSRGYLSRQNATARNAFRIAATTGLITGSMIVEGVRG